VENQLVQEYDGLVEREGGVALGGEKWMIWRVWPCLR
jgi:hypothetical protein